MRGNPSAQRARRRWRLQNTANPTRSAQRSSRRLVVVPRSVSPSYAGSVRHSLRPHFLWRRFPQFTSGGYIIKSGGEKRTITAGRKGDHSENTVTSYYCKQQSRALKGQGASQHSHVFVTGAHEHAHKELSLTCTHLR